MLTYAMAVRRAKQLLGKDGSVGVEYNCNGIPASTWYCVGRRDGDATYHKFIPIVRAASYEAAFEQLEKMLGKDKSVTSQVVA